MAAKQQGIIVILLKAIIYGIINKYLGSTLYTFGTGDAIGRFSLVKYHWEIFTILGSVSIFTNLEKDSVDFYDFGTRNSSDFHGICARSGVDFMVLVQTTACIFCDFGKKEQMIGHF